MHSQELGDYIGAESCADFRPGVVDIVSNDGAGMRRPRPQKRSDAVEKDYPPMIPSLARTAHLPSHVPWVMKRYSTSDGRLVIREEKVRRHEYFQARRSDGRLVLNLVPVDDDVEEDYEDHRAGDEGEEKSDFPENVAVHGEEERTGVPTSEQVHPGSSTAAVAAAVAGFTPPIYT